MNANNVSLIDSNLCTGCGVCTSVCTRNAINLVEKKENYYFLSPQVNKNLCISCGACLLNCPFALAKQETKYTKKSLYVSN